MELHYPLILDGSTGTQLQKRGYDGGVCAEAWSIDHPEVVRDFQKEYLQAGSQVLYSPTFGANRVKLEENGIFNKVYDFNYKLASISKKIAGDKAYVAGDIAPTGKFLAPLGDTPFEEMVEIYTEQAKGLQDAGVDFFIIETMMTVPEARAALLAVKSVSDKPVFVTFSVDEKGNTLTGSDIEAVLEIMQGMGADAFGLNCSVGPKEMLESIKRLTDYAEVPLIAKANAGLPKVVDGKTVYDCPPETFADCVPGLARAGVQIFGGCCGTMAEHVKAIADAVKNVKLVNPNPKYTDLLPLCTEKKLFLLPKDVKPGKILPCDENLGEALEEAETDDEKLITVKICREDELDNFADYQYAIYKPLCLMCQDESILEQALRLYQGRAMYDGNLPEDFLRKMGKKYGLIY